MAIVDQLTSDLHGKTRAGFNCQDHESRLPKILHSIMAVSYRNSLNPRPMGKKNFRIANSGPNEPSPSRLSPLSST